MSIGEQIRRRREELGFSQAELAKRIGVTQGSIGNYESGVSNPKMELMPKIFEALKTDANYIFRENVEPHKSDINYHESLMINKYRTLDPHGKEMVDTVLEMEYTRCTATEQDEDEEQHITLRLSYLAASAGTGDYLDSEDYEHITVKRTETTLQADFAVRVNGDSMEPTYHDGEILLVEGTPYINVGDIGIFVVNGNGYVKEYGGDRLISHNEDFEDIMLHDYDVVICSGRVIGVLEE